MRLHGKVQVRDLIGVRDRKGEASALIAACGHALEIHLVVRTELDVVADRVGGGIVRIEMLIAALRNGAVVEEDRAGDIAAVAALVEILDAVDKQRSGLNVLGVHLVRSIVLMVVHIHGMNARAAGMIDANGVDIAGKARQLGTGRIAFAALHPIGDGVFDIANAGDDLIQPHANFLAGAGGNVLSGIVRPGGHVNGGKVYIVCLIGHMTAAEDRDLMEQRIAVRLGGAAVVAGVYEGVVVIAVHRLVTSCCGMVLGVVVLLILSVGNNVHDEDAGIESAAGREAEAGALEAELRNGPACGLCLYRFVQIVIDRHLHGSAVCIAVELAVVNGIVAVELVVVLLSGV